MGARAALGSTRVLVVADDTQRALALELRRRVFVEEQGVPLEEELDGKDDAAVHFLLLTTVVPGTTAVPAQVPAAQARPELKGTESPVACARVRELKTAEGEPCIKLERVAVLAGYRGLGLGVFLVRQVLQRYQALGDTAPRLVVIHAQLDAVGFWGQLGFTAVGQRFLEAGIWHQEMKRGF